MRCTSFDDIGGVWIEFKINWIRTDKTRLGRFVQGHTDKGISKWGFPSSPNLSKCDRFVCISFAGPNATALDLSVVGDIPIDNEMPVVTSSVSSRGFVGPVFVGAHKGSICVDVL